MVCVLASCFSLIFKFYLFRQELCMLKYSTFIFTIIYNNFRKEKNIKVQTRYFTIQQMSIQFAVFISHEIYVNRVCLKRMYVYTLMGWRSESFHFSKVPIYIYMSLYMSHIYIYFCICTYFKKLFNNMFKLFLSYLAIYVSG